ncbi:MAG: lamin tail domain-containing protein [bacterium]
MQRRHLLFFLTLFTAVGVLAYDNQITHPGLTELAIKTFDSQSRTGLTTAQANWIIKGSIAEDADPRYLNHFYNPITGQGLGGNINAKDWMLGGGWGGATGDFSASAALENYRSGNVQRAYESVGHILHLFQDMTVPAHVRGDPHVGDYYETWVKSNYKTINAGEVNIGNLETAFTELAKYTHDNFYSKNTVDGSIKYDEIISNFNFDKNKVSYIYKNKRKLAQIRFEYEGNVLDLDQAINSDYYAQLAPKAVGYSAGVIAYFEVKFAEIDRERALENKTEITFMGTGLTMLAQVWQNTNYIINDVLGSAAVQSSVSQVVEAAKTSAVVIDKTGQATIASVNKAVTNTAKTATQAQKLITQIPVQVAIKTIDTTNNLIDTLKSGAPDKQAVLGVKIAQAKIPALVPPVQASELINILLNPPALTDKTSQLSTFYPPSPFAYSAGSPLVETIANRIVDTVSELPSSTIDPIDPPAILPSEPPVITPEESPTDPINPGQGGDVLPPVINDGAFGAAPVGGDQSGEISESVEPETTIYNYPANVTNQRQFEFMFGSDKDNVQYEYRLDGETWRLCDYILNLEVLEGEHQIEVRSFIIDASSTLIYDLTPAVFAWTVDLTAPSVEFVNVPLDLDSQTMQISWQSTAADIYRYRLDENVNQTSWLNILPSATSTSKLINNYTKLGTSQIILNSGDTRQYRVQAIDLVGNISNWATSSIITRTKGHLLISAIKASGVTADDEWVELYNPTSEAISLENYQLKRKSQTGTEYILQTRFGSLTVEPGGYLLIAHPTGYAGSVVPDSVYGSASYALAADNTLILYSGSTTIDKIGFGAAMDKEGASLANLTSGQVAARKIDNGQMLETNNNANDFMLDNNYKPHSAEIKDYANLPEQVWLVNTGVSTTTADLTWSASSKAQKYDLRIEPRNGTCKLNFNWSTALSVDANILATAPGSSQTYKLTGLQVGTSYCVAMRSYGSDGWSVLSNQLEIRTACAEPVSKFASYTVAYTRADNATTPSTTPEYIMVVDLSEGNAYYQIFTDQVCAWNYGGANAYINDGYNTRAMIEFVYDPVTKKLTGQYRFCQQGAWYANRILGNRCRDLDTWWYGHRWSTHSQLVGADTFMIKSEVTNNSTEWLKVAP